MQNILNPVSITCIGHNDTPDKAATDVDQAIATAVGVAQSNTDYPNQIQIIPQGMIYDGTTNYTAIATVIYPSNS